MNSTVSDDDLRPAAAHTTVGQTGLRVHALDQHLSEVARRAADHAVLFGGQDWARQAGLWHDLGKYRPGFQRYLRAASGAEAENAHIEGGAGRVSHSTAGALLACERFGTAGRVLAYLIASHHAGLYDWNADASSLEARLASEASRTELAEALAAAPPEILDHGGFAPNLRAIPGGSAGFALWLRMLFSALVDADFLDTEAFMDEGKAAARGAWPDLATLRAAFDAHMDKLAAAAPDTPVNRLRGRILAQCRAKAAEKPGIFSLTVPTGGGKTLASMAFALDHARLHGQRRVIYVIPYTSIIEQTADVFRGIFGEAVIEHHSNAESDPGRESLRSRLACENWDAPVVVTTSVQFFESLFAARTSRCRKLHHIVNSVVVLDEAQLLPPEFLKPILAVLNLLTRHYGVTVVLSTATQPALARQEYFDPQKTIQGLDAVRELMQGGPQVETPDELYRDLKRVNVRLPADWQKRVAWEALAAELAAHESVLAIVNTRRHAATLHALLPQGTLHLSALMCGAHRADVIATIKARLKAGEPTRVVSTQLVEAGVDLDFPVVYRALAGLDSIAQAAGRCNREGRLSGLGEVVVFVPPDAAPPGLLAKGEGACRSVLHGHAGDPLDRALFERYFRQLYYQCELDKHGIEKLLTVDGKTLAVNFRSAAEKFRLIDDADQASVVVLYRGPDGRDATVDQRLAQLRQGGAERWLLRALQRYTVNIRQRDAQRLLAQGDIEELLPGLFVQVSDVAYDATLGLRIDPAAPVPPAGLIV
ncbi:CRISPR-associated helicase Cas3' [Immundisolibacter sp.]|uniref:CRISPR-associated helicase Cas3' n=1 Tax=Immundisolibacter sp. TaxID=1934948 RepID=UPI00262F4468|nr:CRISPR-associated helicase Cas3' [Immundisolibacter sp.]MDD3651230.1 CRISPR-associated helicase Cas3' [Immundisolibacter sp.]